MKGFTEILRGSGGRYELTRALGAFGGVVYVLGANAFVAWNMAEGREFDIATYCLAFPGGLAAILAAIAGGAAWKDKGVASAEIIRQTGAVPTPAKDGARVPLGEPPPVDNPDGETR